MSVAWLQITARTARPALAEAIFEQYAAEAVTLLDDGDDLTVENEPHAQPGFKRTRAVGLFVQATDPAPIVNAMREALGDAAEVAAERLENQDWASAWLAEHPPLRFGERLWIAPHGAPVDADPAAIVIRLDPGLAFGTGTHATTALCLEWLAGAEVAGRRVLDYGCGSGILAIAAARLGGAHVTAVDIDEQALRATRENARRNAVGARIDTPAMAAVARNHYDIVIANILAQPLIDLAPTLAGHARRGAALVLAGLLTRQADAVGRAFAGDFTIAQGACRDGWARLDGTRRPA